MTYKKLPPQIPFWYSRSWGSERLAFPYFLFLLPLIAAACHLVNLIIAATMLKSYLVFVKMLMTASIFVSGLSLIVLLNIIRLVL
jgi:hypothetical protein